jgi:hypothetical protein
MRRNILSLVFALVPLFFGVALPYVEFPGNNRYLNLFWSPVYGFGLFALDRMAILRSRSPLALLGVIAWPIAVSCALFILGGKVQQGGHTRLRMISLCLLFASSCCIVGLQKSLQPPFSQVPTFYKIFFSIW